MYPPRAQEGHTDCGQRECSEKEPEERKLQSPEGLDCDPTLYARLRGFSVEGFGGGRQLSRTLGSLSITPNTDMGETPASEMTDEQS